MMNAAVSVSGAPGIPDATLASLFCVGPTSSAAMNAVAGLPGLARLRASVHHAP
jgi:hypothetical protein